MFKKRAKYIINKWFNKYFRKGVLPPVSKELYCAAEFLYLNLMKRVVHEPWYDKEHHHKMCSEIRALEPSEMIGSLEYYSDRWYAWFRLYTIMEYAKKQLNITGDLCRTA